MTIVLAGIRKQYGNGLVAVRHLDLEIHDGEFFTLLGPSGCGKTTTLRMIAGLEDVTSGVITIKDRDVTRTPARHRDVAMVFQSYALYPHMNVRDNLSLNLQVRKLPKREIADRVAQVSRMLQIDGVLDRKPGQLSGGQRQRVALGRAIIRRPNVFLMDEPLSNLDLKLREETRTELKKLHETLRITTVYVTHDQSEALVLADRIGIMRDGDLLQVGNPHEVYAAPTDTFVARFIGSPSINLLRARTRVADDVLSIEIPTSGGTFAHQPPPAVASILRAASAADVLLGVRPEDFVLHRAATPGALPARVAMIQPMGSITYALLRLPDGSETTLDRDHLTVAIGPDERLERDQPAWLTIRNDRFCLFDQESGRTLGRV